MSFIRAKLALWTFQLFFELPIYLGRNHNLTYNYIWKTYSDLLAFVFLPFWVVPWFFIAMWSMIVFKGCQFDTARYHLGSLCIPESVEDTQWWLKPWHRQASNEDYLNALPSSIYIVMTGHLAIFDAHGALLDQSRKIREILPLTDPRKDKLQDHLSKPSVIEAPLSIGNRLTDCSGTGEVLNMLPPLADQWKAYSEAFCLEKDQINYAYRDLIEAYAIALRVPGYYMTWPWLMFFPLWYITRFWNHLFEVSWLPQPRVYHLQVKAHIYFHIQGFVQGAIAALARIASQSPTNIPYDSTARTQTFMAAIATLTDLEQTFNERIAGYLWWYRWIRTTEELKLLEESVTIVTRVRRYILAIEKLTSSTELSFKRLSEQLKSFGEHLKGHSCTLPSKELSASLELSADNPWYSALRSRMAQVCTVGGHGRNIPRDLWSLCLIHNMGTIVSDIDDDTLGSFQRSWLMERTAAIHRYTKRMMQDPDSAFDLAD